MDARLAVHDKLSSWFVERTDLELSDLLARAAPRPGWGMTRTIEVAGHPVFVKTIPVTDLELANPASTRNHFDLPIVYNYGIGSAGFGAAREVAAHATTTQWVREGANGGFPLLYHHRLLPLAGQTRKRIGEQLERYVAYWDGDPAVRRFIEAREASTHSITMFIEHVPHVLQDWLPLNQDAIGWVIDQATEITTFLRGNGVAHLDSNPSNILTDGKQLFFADFGLFLDRKFDLTDQERVFLESHRYFDIAEFMSSLDWQAPDQPVDFGDVYKHALEPYRALIDEMSAVFSRLDAGPKTSGEYNDSRIASLLAEASSP
ncbi:MAG: hypothetical protein ACK5CE_00320 [Actinomycetes bacterium]